MSERIDAHHHLWRYRKEDYEWIGPGMEALARDFLPADLREEMGACGVDGSVAVQARQSVEETDWLLELARESNFIRGVVGWAPIASAEFPSVLERWRGNSLLKGLRHVIQDEVEDGFINRKDFNAGIAALAGSNLIYDILIYERHLPAAIEFVDRHPNQIFVLDHIAKPRIKEREIEPWRRNLFELAQRGNVYCKLSGMVTEANWTNWSKSDLQPYFDAALEAFGPGRLMVGSDWPVCLLACTFRRWFDTVHEFLTELSTAEKDSILGGVASQVYSLKRASGAEQ
jgi:L-fuconolactonase